MLQNISVFIGIFILSIGEIIFAKIVLEEKISVSKIYLFLILLITTLLSQLTNIYLTGVIKTLVAVIIYVLKFKIVFNLEYTKSLFLTIIYLGLLIIPDVTELFVATSIIGIPKEVYYNQIAGTIYSNIIVCLGMLLVIYVLKKPLRKLINITIENNIKIIISSFLTFVCVLIVFYNAFSNITLNYNLIISIFTMVIFVWILLSLINQTFANNNLTKRYEQILEFMTTYEEEVEKQRILRHETKNAFLTIKAQITDKSKDKEIIDYIDSILEDDTQMKNEEYAKFKNLPPNGIKGLCYFKVQEAEGKGINVSINISDRLPKSILYKLDIKQKKDLGKLLGIYLDNAIEASQESKDKLLGLEVYVLKGNVKFIISNSYKDRTDLNKIGNVKFSTKGKNRGHGLLLAKSIENSNNIFTLENEITDKLYIQKITIKKMKIKKAK